MHFGKKNNLISTSILFILLQAVIFTTVITAQEKGDLKNKKVLNPYEDVDWNKVKYLHSFSHQHGWNTKLFWDMGFRHFPFSNYYPSSPTPLMKEFREEYPDALWAPNAEHHTMTDSGHHWNALGSYYATGHGESAKIQYPEEKKSPVEYVFSGLNVFGEQPLGAGVYFLHYEIKTAGNKKAPVLLSVEGAREVHRRTYKIVGDGKVKEREITVPGTAYIYLAADSERVKVRFDFNPEEISDMRFWMKQGVGRPWREAFRSALDGEKKHCGASVAVTMFPGRPASWAVYSGAKKEGAGNPVEGLMFPDGGGITINHTGGPLSDIIEYLDFDPRVLGIEVWNQRRTFGSESSMSFYNLWDEVLKTGRRCFGFFVKDHIWSGSGRNILLVPDSSELSREERERNALRAYRNGEFFGLLGATEVNESGRPVMPYDYSQFRFTGISVKDSPEGTPEHIEVSVDGADRAKRPNVQIRFITEEGISLIENDSSALFKIKKDAEGNILNKYIRVEAFAYPDTHLNGKPLTAEAVSEMNVFEISMLHDNLGGARIDQFKGATAPIPIVDMIFSQPLLFLE